MLLITFKKTEKGPKYRARRPVETLNESFKDCERMVEIKKVLAVRNQAAGKSLGRAALAPERSETW